MEPATQPNILKGSHSSGSKTIHSSGVLHIQQPIFALLSHCFQQVFIEVSLMLDTRYITVDQKSTIPAIQGRQTNE